VPYVIVQTANSVNAFSDDMAVLLVRGVKRTLPSRWPDALIVDLQVLADAPPAPQSRRRRRTRRDVDGSADWRLAAASGADLSWDERIVRLFRDGAGALLEAAPVRHMTWLRSKSWQSS
jgi:glycerol-1-phosphate dehydrogenase [NAD(P)+]